MTLLRILAVSAALAIALLVLAATQLLPLMAAGGPIEVVAVQERINFPGEVGLILTVEAEQEIVEVRVIFRSVGQRVWRYAYADFEPGTRVVATQDVPASASVYLPPGTEVEYYYEVRDSAGNMLTTDPAVVEYLDDRFDWKRMQIRSLELLYHSRSGSQVGRLAEEIQDDLDRIGQVLQDSPDRPIKGVIYNRASNARDAFPKQSQTTYDHGTFQGFAFTEQGIFVGLGLDRRMIAHESAHLLLRQALGEQATDPPSWLDEGFATYMEPNSRVVSASSLASRSRPLRAMNTVTGTPSSIHTFYDKSHSVVAYLIETHGQDNFRRFLGELGQGLQVNRALIEVYGFGVDGLDTHWANSATTPAPGTERGGGGSISPFVHIDVWVLTGVFFFVAALLFLGAVTRRFRRRPEEAGLLDRYDPDIDIEES